MPTDATGTPTALGIRKYNTSADAPSGLGFNGAMDDIDALLAARVTKPASIVSGEFPVWNGSTWVRSSSVATTGLVPSFRYDYAEFNSDKTSTAITAATAVLVVAGNAVTYDGATAVEIEFFAPYGITVAGQLLNIELYDGASAIGTMGAAGAAAAIDAPMLFRRTLTPSAAAHTYSAKAWNSGAGTGTVKAGAGGSGVLFPGYIKITKV